MLVWVSRQQTKSRTRNKGVSMTKDEALKRAFDWYGSGNQDPDEFEKLILSIVAQPEQEPVDK